MEPVTGVIRTDRLILRRFELSDVEDMLKNWISDPDVQSGYGEPAYQNRTDVVELLESWLPQYRWAIVHLGSGENIGHVSFCRLYEAEKTAEIEYCIGKAWWGQGMAAEAVAAFIQYIFRNTGIAKLEAFHRAENPASGRVLQKAGMKRADTVLRFGDKSKVPDGDVCYTITREAD